MKPLFAIDITHDKKNEVFNGAEFITRTSSQEKRDDLESKRDALDESLKGAKLPLWMRIIKCVCGYFALIFAGVSLSTLTTIGLAQAIKNAPLLFIGGAISTAVWIYLFVLDAKRSKEVWQEQHADTQLESIESDAQGIYDELGVPHDADSVDILLFRYTEKDGEKEPKAVGFQTIIYYNVDIKAYVTEEGLHLADLEHVYTFKSSELVGIKTVHKRIVIPLWNKEEGVNEGKYKPYKITPLNTGDFSFKTHHILEIEREDERYGVYFPCYELDIFERLTGLKAEE